MLFKEFASKMSNSKDGLETISNICKENNINLTINKFNKNEISVDKEFNKFVSLINGNFKDINFTSETTHLVLKENNIEIQFQCELINIRNGVILVIYPDEYYILSTDTLLLENKEDKQKNILIH
jgi:hypothetical protein